MKKKYRFAIIVWGDWHTDKLLSCCIPTLLSENNLPALAKRADISFAFHTTPANKVKIEASSGFAHLRSIALINFKLHESFSSDDTYNKQHDHRNIEQQWARENKAYLVCLPPDTVLSDGLLLAVDDLFSSGKDAVYVRPVRVTSETFTKEFSTRFTKNERGAISINSDTLLKMMPSHLHPWVLSQFEDSPTFSEFPEWISWPIREDGELKGILARCPFPTDFLFLAPHSSLRANINQVLDESYDYSRIGVLSDARKGCMVSLLPLAQYLDWYIDKGPVDEMQVAKISTINSNCLSDWISQQDLYYLWQDVGLGVLSRIQRRANRFMRRQNVMRIYMSIITICQSFHLYNTGAFLSYLLCTRKRMARFDLSRYFTVLLPIDASFEGGYQLGNLLERIDNSEEEDLLKRHILPGRFSFVGFPDGNDGVVTNLAGQELKVNFSERKIGNAKWITSSFEANGVLVLMIDGVIE